MVPSSLFEDACKNDLLYLGHKLNWNVKNLLVYEDNKNTECLYLLESKTHCKLKLRLAKLTEIS